jgi:hypothetical protein
MKPVFNDKLFNSIKEEINFLYERGVTNGSCKKNFFIEQFIAGKNVPTEVLNREWIKVRGELEDSYEKHVHAFFKKLFN